MGGRRSRPKGVGRGWEENGYGWMIRSNLPILAYFLEFGGYKFGSSGKWVYFCRPKNVEFMANHKATKKDVRQAEKRRDRNRYNGKTTRNAIRDLRAEKGQKEAGEQLPEVASMIDKLAKKGVIHKNKAANLKSKLARKVNALTAAK
jgi:small subunit ribosomal protein S20